MLQNNAKIIFIMSGVGSFWNEGNGLMGKVLDFTLEVRVFEPQWRYCDNFQTNNLGKSMNPLIPPAINLIESLILFYKDGFGIKYW